MTDLRDLVLDKDREPSRPERSPQSRVAWATAGLALVVAAATLYWYGNPSTPSGAKTMTPAAKSVPIAPRTPLGIETAPVVLPPLDETDAFVRDLVSGLSSHPTVTAWLATPGLIRNFVVVVDNISTGMTPAHHLRVLAPRGPFRVIENDGEITADPASYRRYDAIAAGVSGLDPSGVVRVYSTLKPRVDEAYRELGYESPFDVALETAIISILRTPVIDGKAALVPRGALYRFADPHLEGLTAAQRQFLMMGPEHVRAVQLAVRRIALALGIPGNRLPPS